MPFFYYRTQCFWRNKTTWTHRCRAWRILCITILPGESLSHGALFMKWALWCCYLHWLCCMHKSLSSLPRDYSSQRSHSAVLNCINTCVCACTSTAAVRILIHGLIPTSLTLWSCSEKYRIPHWRTLWQSKAGVFNINNDAESGMSSHAGITCDHQSFKEANVSQRRWMLTWQHELIQWPAAALTGFTAAV